jgi:rhamnulokinase
MVQARAAGMVETLQQMRDMIAKAVETTLFVPGDTQDWEEAYNRFVRIIK